VQYYGWAYLNRAALIPTYEDTLASIEFVERERERLKGVLTIDMVVPDYYAKRPKPCMGGWGKGFINITPAGKVLPCHAAETIPGLEFDNVQERKLLDIWLNGQAFNAFRGTDWMKEPCRSCAFKDIDFAAAAARAIAITAAPRNTDPACAIAITVRWWLLPARKPLGLRRPSSINRATPPGDKAYRREPALAVLECSMNGERSVPRRHAILLE
jgi:pyrroloquinoline quinone biosynthesis protein E